MATAGFLATWFLIFLTYSFIGWAMEVIISVFMTKKVSNRGFLIGPLCPIYGFGIILISLILHNTDNIFEIFAVAFVSCAVLEYVTSYVMEKLFRVRWWDYSDNPFNLNGRICLKPLVRFGIASIIVIKFANPFLVGLFGSINEVVRVIIAAVLLGLFITDIAVSLWLIIKCRVAASAIQNDATDEIAANIREVLMGQGKLNRRLAKAFPGMKVKKKSKKPKKDV